MKHFFLSVTLAACLMACTKESTEVKEPVTSSQDDGKFPGYKLVWSDEFDYTGLPDSTKWSYEKGHIRNDETQYYEVARLKNSQVKNGYLNITARNDNYHNHGVTSASVTTKNKEQFLYGKFVVRAKMPVGMGAWPAIWLEGINRDTIHWPFCGEIDIMEWLGWMPNYILGSLYTSNPLLQDTTAIVTPYDVGDASTLSAKFHTYSIEWDSTQVKYFYDDLNYATYAAANMSAEEWAPFTKPQYLILNLAMGGTAGGTIDTAKYPFTYQVDYVRYYQKQ